MGFQLHGRIVMDINIHVITGLHIGGAAGKLEIGGVDSPVLRDPITQQPYIPGSSVRGKMRSLIERVYGREQNQKIGKDVYIHMLKLREDLPEEEGKEEYKKEFREDETCSIFGVSGDQPAPHPTALIVRDAQLSAASAAKLKAARTDLPYTEVKWEATIDRVTSAATPRQIERVPAGAIFEGLELIYNVYEASNLKHFPKVLQALTLVEEDYLGGLGSRGSGKVRFELVRVYARNGSEYTATEFGLPAFAPDEDEPAKLEKRSLRTNREPLINWVNGLNLIAQNT
jgi:CRISPR-associated protein Csm3